MIPRPPWKPASPEGKPTVTVLDYGSGNVRSAVRALERAGAEVILSSKPEDVLNADGLVVPGVGAFETVMRELKAVDGIRLIGRRVAGGRPVLGICVGLQVLFEAGVEHGTEAEGMGEWPGKVELLPAEVVPHMGWNTVKVPEGSKLFAGVEDERFYFVHSYGVQEWNFDVVQPRMAAAPGHLVRARRAVHRRRRERPALRHPVPPGEVRRRRRPAAAQLGADLQPAAGAPAPAGASHGSGTA